MFTMERVVKVRLSGRCLYIKDDVQRGYLYSSRAAALDGYFSICEFLDQNNLLSDESAILS